MRDTQEALELRLVALRSAFDATFARKAAAPTSERRGYLGIRLNDAPYALDLDEVASVKKHVPVTPLPSAEPRLLGVAGFAGTLAAVYDLSALLGLPSGAEAVWFVRVQGAPVVFAFHGLDGQLRPEADAGSADAGDMDGSDGGADLRWQPGLSRPVIRLGALVERLRGVVAEDPREGAASR